MNDNLLELLGTGKTIEDLDPVVIGYMVKHIRQLNNLNQSQLAELTGLSVSYISLLERGKRDATIETLKNILDKLGVGLKLYLEIRR